MQGLVSSVLCSALGEGELPNSEHYAVIPAVNKLSSETIFVAEACTIKKRNVLGRAVQLSAVYKRQGYIQTAWLQLS